LGLAARKMAPRVRVLSEAELRAIWNACEATFGTIVRLLILTGQRRGEIAALQPSFISDDAVTLPARLCKNNREHTFPIGPMTRTLLAPVIITTETALLFPARGKPTMPFNGWGKCKAQLDKKSGVANWTLHDLRRTFATQLAALGTPIHVTERLLNHISGTQSGIVAVYQRHTYMDEMRAAVMAWEARLADIVQ
jgi:integrase